MTKGSILEKNRRQYYLREKKIIRVFEGRRRLRQGKKEKKIRLLAKEKGER